MNAPDAFPSPWDGFQLASLVPVTSRSSGGGAIPPACRGRHAQNASVTPFLFCVDLWANLVAGRPSSSARGTPRNLMGSG